MLHYLNNDALHFTQNTQSEKECIASASIHIYIYILDLIHIWHENENKLVVTEQTKQVHMSTSVHEAENLFNSKKWE